MARKYAKKMPAKRYYKRRSVPRQPSKAMVKTIKSVIHAQQETKQAFTAFPATAFNSGVSNSGDICRIIPNINQGTADNQRIADQIRGQSLVVKGFIQIAPLLYQSSTAFPTPLPNSRVAVRLMVVQPKQYVNFTDIQSAVTTWSGALLRKGGTNVGFTGAISDLWAPLNTAVVTKYYDKVHYLTSPTNLVPSGVTTNDNMSIDLSKTTKFFNIKLPMRNKLLSYDNSASSNLLPVKYSPVLILGYVNLDGTIDTLTANLTMAYDAILTYEDA